MRLAAKIEYRGRDFCGSQLQVGVRTVASELERALGIFFRQKERLVAIFAGRTDSGVHAIGQVVHFDVSEAQLAAGRLNLDGSGVLPPEDLARLGWGLNGILPGDLSISCINQVPRDFHARSSATKRSYVYRILNRAQRSALRHETHYLVLDALEVEVMKASCSMLLGTHDFGGFRSSGADRSSTICSLETAQILNLGEGELEFRISADHFVYNMVRIIVGTLVEIGLGKRCPSSLEEALSEKRRELAGPTAPAWGLCLTAVEYPSRFNLFPEVPTRRSQENVS